MKTFPNFANPLQKSAFGFECRQQWVGALGFVQQRTCGDCTAMPVSCQFHIKREKLRARGFDLDDNLSGRHLLAFCDIDGGNRA
jgi:hypothetical protein